MLDTKFLPAVSEYRFLINRDYPKKGALKLVADHHRLSGSQRTILFRGVLSDKETAIRKKKTVSKIQQQPILIDTCNVLSTLLNYHLGMKLFIADDGFLRDDGENYPKTSVPSLMERQLRFLKDFLSENNNQCKFFIDSVFEKKAKLRDSIKRLWKPSLPLIIIQKSADRSLLNETRGTICTADGFVIQNSSLPVFDLTKDILSVQYQVNFPEIPV